MIFSMTLGYIRLKSERLIHGLYRKFFLFIKTEKRQEYGNFCGEEVWTTSSLGIMGNVLYLQKHWHQK